MDTEAVAGPESPYGLSLRLRLQCPMCGSERLFRDGLRKLRDGSSIQRWLCRGCGYRFSFGPKNLMGKAEKSQALALNPSSSLTSDRQGSHEGPDPGPSPGPDPKPEPDPEPDLGSGPKPGPGIGTGTGTRTGTGAPIALEAMKTLAGEAKGWKSQDAGATTEPNTTTTTTTATEQKTDELLFRFGWHMRRKGYAEVTIKTWLRKLRRLAVLGAELLDPESVKEAIAKADWKENTKNLTVSVYTAFLESMGKTWEPPSYRKVEEIPFIPTEEEIDQLIASCGKRTAAFLQLLKETGMRAGEAARLRWADIDFQRRVVKVTPEKGSAPRMLRVSEKLLGMLAALPRREERIFKPVSSMRSTFCASRKRAAKKLQNPRLLEIHFHTLRHWKATMEYHKTKDVLHVKNLLGHRSIDNTLLYIQIEQALFDNQASDEFICKAARSAEEAGALIEVGFEYVCTTPDAIMLFRKRK